LKSVVLVVQLVPTGESISRPKTFGDCGTGLLGPVVPVAPEGRSPAADAVPRTTATTVHSAVVPGQGQQEDTQRQSFAGPGTSATAGTTKNEQLRAPQKDAFEERAAIIEYDAGFLTSSCGAVAHGAGVDELPRGDCARLRSAQIGQQCSSLHSNCCSI
jgi:hypothetical protein